MIGAMNTTAHCRTCDRIMARSILTERHDVGRGNTYDRCRFCNSIDVDIMSPEGVAHEFNAEVLT